MTQKIRKTHSNVRCLILLAIGKSIISVQASGPLFLSPHDTEAMVMVVI